MWLTATAMDHGIRSANPHPEPYMRAPAISLVRCHAFYVDAFSLILFMLDWVHRRGTRIDFGEQDFRWWTSGKFITGCGSSCGSTAGPYALCQDNGCHDDVVPLVELLTGASEVLGFCLCMICMLYELVPTSCIQRYRISIVIALKQLFSDGEAWRKTMCVLSLQLFLSDHVAGVAGDSHQKLCPTCISQNHSASSLLFIG